MDFSFNLYDEGLTLYGSVRVLHGQLPYRDFWTMYGPGEFYLLAAIFKLFGVSAIWGRAVYLAVNTVTLGCVFSILQMLTRKLVLSLGVTLLILIWMSGLGSYGFPIYPALALILLATLAMFVWWREGRYRMILRAGVALGVSALFRHDLGLYALIALGGANLYFRALSGNQGERLRPGLRDLFALCVGALIPFLPVFLALCLSVPAKDLFYSLLYVPGRIYPKVRSLPFPNAAQVLHGFANLRSLIVDYGDVLYNVVWVPTLVAATALSCLIPASRRRTLPPWQLASYMSLLLLTVLLFLKGWVRVSPLHMSPSIVIAIALFGALVPLVRSLVWPAKLATGFTFLWLTGCMFAATHAFVHTARINSWRLFATDQGQSLRVLCHPPAGMERARCLSVPPEEEQALLYIHRQTQPQESIFVGSLRHDMLYANDIGFYFISGRDAATKWHDLHPGVEDTAPVQRQIVADLERKQARFVIRESLNSYGKDTSSGPNPGAMILDHFIDENYTLAARFAGIYVLRRATPFSGPKPSQAMGGTP